MKTLTDNQLGGELGETVVKAKILELGHVFEGRGRLETGVDGTIEFRDPVTRAMTGLTVAVQVKTTKSGRYVSETDDSFEYSVRQQDIDYWRQCSLPVALILYRQSDGSLYWRDVETGAIGDERRLKFEKVRDRLDSASIERLASMAVRRGRELSPHAIDQAFILVVIFGIWPEKDDAFGVLVAEQSKSLVRLVLKITKRYDVAVGLH